MTPARRAWISRVLKQLEGGWGVSDLAKDTCVQFSTRLTVSLGRTVPERRTIRLRADLESAAAPLLREVLTHEFAHVVVWARYGAAAKPHGPEWRMLVRATGFEPRTRLLAPQTRNAAHAKAQRTTYVHTCLVCQVARRARRPMRRWRCAACRAAGLSGELVIERTQP